jgi:sugar phosphate isomerase/epimerase
MCSSQDAVTAVKSLGSPNLGVVIDSGHINLSGEDTAQAIQNLGDLLLQVHVNDNDGKQQHNAIPGEGTYDFPRLVRVLRQTGYEGFLSLELGWNYTFDPVPAVREALRRMQDYLQI